MGRKLASKVSLVDNASNQIAKQDLDTPILASTGIREFNTALKSMDNMRRTLKDTLIKQWESEQMRKQEIIALAHDIKTPLTVISGNAELLLEDDLGEEQNTLVKSIYNVGLRAGQYVNVLRQVLVIDVDHEKIERIDIVSLLNDIDIILSPLGKEKSISMEYVYSENLRSIEGYLSLLSRALINIIENAIRFTDVNGNITISIRQNEKETLFSVLDDGVGFSEEALQHGSEMFWKQEKSRNGGQHYGVGLSIVAKVATKHGGKLILENTPKGGCVKLVIVG